MSDEMVVEHTEQVAAPDNAAQSPETVTPDVAEQSVDAGTTENATPEAETDEQKNDKVKAEEQQKTEKKARGWQKRVDELTRDKYAERQAREALQKQNEELLRVALGKGGTTAQSDQQTDGRPNPASYVHGESDAQYIRDDAVWMAEQRTRAILSENARQQSEAQAKHAQEQSERAVTNAYMTRQREIAKNIPDFDATMAEGAQDISVPNPVFDMIRRMPDGPLVAYHMVKNPALTEQFFSNPPELHGILLGQLSATLKGSAKISNAPPPGKPVQAKSGSSSSPPEDTAAYFAWAEKHMR